MQIYELTATNLDAIEAEARLYLELIEEDTSSLTVALKVDQHSYWIEIETESMKAVGANAQMALDRFKVQHAKTTTL